MNITVFKRREIKYLINGEQRAALERAFEKYMIPDAHGESTICNVYYDTPDFRLIRQSLEKPVYKEKLRIRSYGRAKDNDKIFVELKKKYKGIVYKRRITAELTEAVDFLADKAELNDDSQIGKEIKYFKKFYGELVPAMYLCYDRTAYFCSEDDGLRITFDKNILWRTDRVRLTSHPNGRQLLQPGQSLMEIKAGDAMPAWLIGLLNELEIRPVSFSKYGTAYKTMINERTLRETERGVYCA